MEEGDDRARLLRQRWSTRDSASSASSIDIGREACDAACKTLDELFATGPRDKWVDILREADIVSAPINTLLEASNDPDVVANGYVTEVEYPKHGKKLKVHGSPWQFSETPAQRRHRAGSSASTTSRC